MTSGVKRKTNETDALKKRIVDYITDSVGGTFAAACKAVSVSRTAGYEWRQADPEFDNAVNAARITADANGGDLAESKLMGLIAKDNLTAIIFYLKTKHKHRGYVEKSIISHHKPPANLDFDNITMEEAEAAYRDAMRRVT